MTVWENMMSLLETREELTKEERSEKANSLLQEFHIEHVKNTRGDALSGGERRRAEIARALTMDPSFILLDEPFAGVDPLAVEDIQSVVMQNKRRIHRQSSCYLRSSDRKSTRLNSSHRVRSRMPSSA